jgi:hypothetical protein
MSEQDQYLAMKRLWTKLADGPWVVKPRTAQSADECIAAIIKAAGVYWGDYATGSYYRRLLLTVGGLTARALPDGSTEYSRAAEFPEPEQDGLSWVQRENQKNAQLAKEERARIDREFELRKQAQDVLDAPRKAAARSDFLFQLNEIGFSPEKLESRLAAIEAALETLTRQLAAQTQNGHRPEEVEITI